MKMNCLWCDKPLSKKQIYEAKRGKSKGNACSLKCSNLIRIYKTPQIKLKLTLNICSVCGIEYHREKWMETKVCSRQCAGKLSSIRMKNNNPMHYKKIRDKVKITHKLKNTKPIVQGGNGRGPTKQENILYSVLQYFHPNIFKINCIVKTSDLQVDFKVPTHYKIDIGSKKLKIAIEIDGVSHNSLKVQECDKRKTKFLNLKKWKVLRFTNYQIDNQLTNCVLKVLSMI